MDGKLIEFGNPAEEQKAADGYFNSEKEFTLDSV